MRTEKLTPENFKLKTQNPNITPELCLDTMFNIRELEVKILEVYLNIDKNIIEIVFFIRIDAENKGHYIKGIELTKEYEIREVISNSYVSKINKPVEIIKESTSEIYEDERNYKYIFTDDMPIYSILAKCMEQKGFDRIVNGIVLNFDDLDEILINTIFRAEITEKYGRINIKPVEQENMGVGAFGGAKQ